MAVPTCPLCGGALGASLLTISEPDRFEKAAGVSADGYVRDWRECEGCHAAIDCLSEDSRTRLQALATNYYDVDVGAGRIGERFQKITQLPATQSDNKQRVKRIKGWLESLPAVDRPRRALDIGAGLGVFLYEFLEPSWEGVAVEPDALAAAHLRTLEKFTVEQSLFDRSSQLGKFDFISLNKVIEHIERPHQLLADCRDSLAAPLGFVYVEVPDAETIGRRPSNDNILGALHWHLHTAKSLTTLLEGVGFHILHLTRAYEPSGKISLCVLATNAAGREFLANKK